MAKTLIRDIGVRVEQFEQAYDQKLYSKMGTAAFFDKETFGEDRLLTGMNSTPWPEFLAQAPLSDEVRRDIARVYTEKKDYLAAHVAGGEERVTQENQLCGIPDEILQGDAQGSPIFSNFYS